MNGKYVLVLALFVLGLLALPGPAVADYAKAFAASGYGLGGFCLDPALFSWGWAMPPSGWGWAWPTF